jgi:type VI protein secretion system component VasF
MSGKGKKMKIEIDDGGLVIEDGDREVSLTIHQKVDANGALLSAHKAVRGNDMIDLAAWLMTFAQLDEPEDQDVWERFHQACKDAMTQIARESRRRNHSPETAPAAEGDV